MLAAVLVIKELAESAPAVMSARVADACRLLWLPLSQSESAREHAAEALGSCLRLASMVNPLPRFSPPFPPRDLS